ncbi:hypothetical protein NLG97_g5543 [Lecanicillium saksenae]|uniref:Uncharacterized protein n=1 Tax=Lecanicillium saksenae TaxID=468837 RepID=A0ACC1QW03_9HYPO|nr:hypothetical protein NLG97_g5543 [Lecanicillium saksenae]
MASTAAQDEFNQLVSNNTARTTSHPEDKHDNESDHDLSEEETYRNAQIDAAMRTPTASSELKLPPASFDSGRFTGVKGVIADARSYETARKTKWIDRARNARRSILGFAGVAPATGNSVTITGGARSRSDSETDEDAKSNNDDDFLSEWRESRRRELESAANRAVRTRKTSPSVRIYGRMDEVDAMGYLDAIEKVSRDTTVVVFVYDHECEVSATIEDALVPLVRANPTTHFVKVHYDDIEFDPAAVPALLAYRNQGDLVANLTGIIEMMPDDDSFDSGSLKRILQQHQVL